MPDRIGIIGAAPSSRMLAPFDDPEWTLWACSAGKNHDLKRVDAWFEVHNIERLSRKAQYHDRLMYLVDQEYPVWLTEPHQNYPNAKIIPTEEIVAEHGTEFLTSSIAWMIAMALREKPKEIGFWGVDMCSADEWAYQKQGCLYFIKVARERDIEITVPPESDLLEPPRLYGVWEHTRRYRKLMARKEELQGRLNAAKRIAEEKKIECAYLRGAIEDLEYVIRTWG